MYLLTNSVKKCVHCHVGSLERKGIFIHYVWVVHCHVGSLEMNIEKYHDVLNVHCHVGSLEIRKNTC